MATRRLRRLRWVRTGVAALATLAVALGFLMFRDGPVASRIEAATLDWRFRVRGPLPEPDAVVILAIDDATVELAGRFPLPRQLLADAIQRLAAAGAGAVGIDLLLLDPEDAAAGLALSPGDRALADALGQGPAAELAFAFTFDAPVPPDANARAALAAAAFPVVRWPAGATGSGLLQAAGAILPMAPLLPAAAVGHVNLPVDADGALRHVLVGIAMGDLVLPAFPVALARERLGLAPAQTVFEVGRSLELGGRRLPLDARSRLALNYYGPPGRIATISLADLLEGRADPALIRGRVALIGATALGVGDNFVTPFGGALSGVEVLATAVANIAGGGPLDHGTVPLGISLAAIFVLGALAFAATEMFPPLVMAGASAALLAGWAAIAELAFAQDRLWLDVAFPSAAVLLAAAIGFTDRMLAERGLRRDFQRQRRNLLRYHSPLIGELLADSDAAATAGREQPATILFVDMAGFTRRVEAMRPAETAHFLREFHRRIEAAALAHGGVLEQFTGDGAMVVFGLPEPRPGDAAAALACARRLVEEIGLWNASLAQSGGAPLGIRVGVHHGPVALATLGGEAQRQMTVAGDTVNVASRLEALARQQDAVIVISDAVAVAVREAGSETLLEGFVSLPPQPIPGRAAPLAVWVLRRAALPASR